MPYIATDKTEQTQAEVGTLHKDLGTALQSMHIEEQIHVRECDKEITSRANLSEGMNFTWMKFMKYVFIVLEALESLKLHLLIL